MQLLLDGFDDLHRGIFGMTWEAACRTYQLVIASPKTVAIAYHRSELEMQRNCVLLFHQQHSKLYEPGNPRQKIAYSFFNCYRPIFRAKQFWTWCSVRTNTNKTASRIKKSWRPIGANTPDPVRAAPAQPSSSDQPPQFLSASRDAFDDLGGPMGSGTQEPSREIEALIVNATRQEPRER
jgi:hypothetical protein